MKSVLVWFYFVYLIMLAVCFFSGFVFPLTSTFFKARNVFLVVVFVLFFKPQIWAVHFTDRHNKNSGQDISEKHAS